MHFPDFLGSELSELIAVKNGLREWVYLATCKAALPYINLGRSPLQHEAQLNTMFQKCRFCVWELDFRDPPAVIRLTVYCWLHIPAQGDRDPGRLEHF